MNTPHPFWGSIIIGVESRSDAVEFRQAVAETGKKLGLRHRRRFHGAHKAVDPERRPRCSVSRKIRLHRRGPEAIDSNAPSVFRR
jgi:hypothetical protein